MAQAMDCHIRRFVHLAQAKARAPILEDLFVFKLCLIPLADGLRETVAAPTRGVPPAD